MYLYAYFYICVRLRQVTPLYKCLEGICFILWVKNKNKKQIKPVQQLNMH